MATSTGDRLGFISGRSRRPRQHRINALSNVEQMLMYGQLRYTREFRMKRHTIQLQSDGAIRAIIRKRYTERSN